MLHSEALRFMLWLEEPEATPTPPALVEPFNLGRIARDRRHRRVLEDISDRAAIEEEREKPSRPLRDYVAERERRERGGLKAAR